MNTIPTAPNYKNSELTPPSYQEATQDVKGLSSPRNRQGVENIPLYYATAWNNSGNDVNNGALPITASDTNSLAMISATGITIIKDGRYLVIGSLARGVRQFNGGNAAFFNVTINGLQGLTGGYIGDISSADNNQSYPSVSKVFSLKKGDFLQMDIIGQYRQNAQTFIQVQQLS